MNATKALATIEEEFGGVEEFAYAVLTHPDKGRILDETESITARAETLGMPVVLFSRIMSTPAFKAALRTAIVNSNFGFFDEERHIREIVKVATGEERKVMSPKGEIGFVDQAPGDIIAAGRYLNDLRGTSVDPKGGAGGGNTISIQILNANQETADAAVGLTIESASEVHTPRRAGSLPPRGVLERGSRSVPHATAAAGAEGALGDGAGAASAAPQSQAQSPEGLLPQPDDAGNPEENRLAAETKERALTRTRQLASERRQAWDDFPNRKTTVPVASKPGRYGD